MSQFFYPYARESEYPSTILPEELEEEGLYARSTPAFWIVPGTTTSINLGSGLSFPCTTTPTMRMPEATIPPVVDSRRQAQAPEWPSSGLGLIHSPSSAFPPFSIRTVPYPQPTLPQYQETNLAKPTHHLTHSSQSSFGLNSHLPQPNLAQIYGTPCDERNPGPQSDGRQPIPRGPRTDPLATARPRVRPAKKDARGGILGRLFRIFKRP